MVLHDQSDHELYAMWSDQYTQNVTDDSFERWLEIRQASIVMEDDSYHGLLANHPKVRELSERLAQIELNMQILTREYQPTADFAKREAVQADEMRRRFEEELSRKQKSVLDARVAAEKMRVDLSTARWDKDNLSRQLREEMDKLMASQRLLELDERFNKFLSDNKWLWSDKIRPYQLDSVKFMAGAHDRGLFGIGNCDQMGLGKTLQALATIDILAAEHAIMCDEHESWHDSVLYVVPASVRDTTAQELRRWNPDRPVAPLEGPPAQRSEMAKMAHRYGMTLVVNYEQLRSTPDLLWTEYKYTPQGMIVGPGWVKGMELTDSRAQPTPRLWKTCILDEAHKFKNDKAGLFALVETLCLHCELIFPMTGTPIQNRPEEFWAILHMLTLKGRYAGKFARKDRFISEYCWQYGTETSFRPGAIDDLMKSVSNMIIRRTKAECLKDLPAKTGGVTRFKEEPDELVRYVDLAGEQLKLYEQMRDRFFVWLDEQTHDAIAAPVVIAQFTRLRQIALLPAAVGVDRVDIDTELVIKESIDCTESAKFDECIELMDELGVGAGTKVLIFTSYEREVIDVLKNRIMQAFGTPEHPCEVGRITGKETSQAKAVTQSRFTDPEDQMRVVIGTTRAMGIGLNLQGACSDAIFLDLDWNPGIIEQAEDRLHRAGQQGAVCIYTIQARNTIDGYIKKKVMNKLDMISGVVDRQELRQAFKDGLI